MSYVLMVVMYYLLIQTLGSEWEPFNVPIYVIMYYFTVLQHLQITNVQSVTT